MDSDNVVFVALFAMIAVGLLAGAWVGVEKQRTERAAIERGCPTPPMSADSHTR